MCMCICVYMYKIHMYMYIYVAYVCLILYTSYMCTLYILVNISQLEGCMPLKWCLYRSLVTRVAW